MQKRAKDSMPAMMPKYLDLLTAKPPRQIESMVSYQYVHCSLYTLTILTTAFFSQYNSFTVLKNLYYPNVISTTSCRSEQMISVH